jgi:transcriptional regulator with XRE-family HTH domain
MLAAEWRTVCGALGAAVRDLRTLLGWSQAELAARAVTSQGTISRLERGGVPGVPLHSVVVVVRALAAGAGEGGLPMTPAARALITFCQLLTPGVTVVAPLEPELATLVRLYQALPGAARAALVRCVAAAVELREVAA